MIHHGRVLFGKLKEGLGLQNANLTCLRLGDKSVRALRSVIRTLLDWRSNKKLKCFCQNLNSSAIKTHFSFIKECEIVKSALCYQKTKEQINGQ